MIEQNELIGFAEEDEVVLKREGNPVEIDNLRPFDISTEDTELAREKETILTKFRKNYTNRFGQKLSEGGEKDEWVLVSGRIQPFTPGHGLLCDAAMIAGKNVTFVVGSANRIDERNPFPPEDREVMIRTYFKEKGFKGELEVIYQDDLYGDRPGSTDFAWGDEVLKKVERNKQIDAVISSPESKWINKIFRSRGKKVVEVDMFNRNNFVATGKRAQLLEEGKIQPGPNYLNLKK